MMTSPISLSGKIAQPPLTSAQLLSTLNSLKIAQYTISHPPLYTVEHSKAHRQRLRGGFSKNLFLRNKKGKMWLLTCLEDRRIDLKQLGAMLGAGRLSFASPQRLMQFLGVTPGAVTPFAVINDNTNAVTLILDTELMKHNPLNFHPLVNTKTTTLSAEDLVKVLYAVNHPPTLLDLQPASPLSGTISASDDGREL